LASKICIADKVKLNEELVKPSKTAVTGSLVSIKVVPIWRTFKIVDIPKSRVGAKIVGQYIREITSSENLDLLSATNLANRQNKILGIKGRPTKKDRRDIDKFSS
jgi:ribosome-associated heat shock protein Hsp15